MVLLIKQNIFNEIKGNSLQVKNIKNFFGSRLIDILTQSPLKILSKDIKEDIKNEYINTFISVDLIIERHVKPFNNKSPYKIIAKNKNNQTINILYFGKFKNFLTNKFLIHEKYRVSGKLYFFSNTFQFIHPNEVLMEKDFGSFENNEPIYNLSRKKINKKFFRKLILNTLEIFEKSESPSEWIKAEIIKNNKWENFKKSLINLHKPKLFDETYDSNRKRLAFDELLSNFLIFHRLRIKQKKTNSYSLDNFELSEKIRRKLNFQLTRDQLKTINEIKNELIQKKKVYRLIQGDVGSGKTIVSLLIIADFIKCNYQCVVMAPTEILARQHFEYFNDLLKDYGVEIELLTSKSKNKKEIINKVSSGEINLLIGTHSVYNKSLNFKNLGLIVIDEQHKFGVNQRINLLEKSVNCHMLIMSATPIPRSLSFAVYGKIDISMIKTKPSGRKKVTTSIISIKKIDDLINGIRRKISKNEQVFWILPHIGNEEGENESEKETVISRYEFIKKVFKNIVGVIHGRMSDDEIKKTMNDFKNKKKMILISTTMIEVGINIPDATLMIIEEANRFGLAQLHQLRGRITRGNLPSNCVLIHNKGLSENSLKRLLILKNSDDGFEIAEKDMFLRGSGDFFGTNQSGSSNWKFFEPYNDIDMINNVKINYNYLISQEIENKEKIEFLIRIFYGKKEFLNYSSA